MCIFQTASRRHLLCCILLAILFTLIAHPQSVEATPQRHSLPYHPLTPSNTLNWAGYVANSTQGITFTEVNMYFTIPTLQATQGKDTALSEWVGLGNSKMLVQAGIGASITSSGVQTTTPWWELYGQGVQGGRHPVNLTVNPKDQLWVYVGSNSDHNSGYDGFLIEDLTNGTYKTAYYYDANGFSDAQTAECIVERPSGGGHFALLANFDLNHIQITGCGVYTNSQGQYAMVPIGTFSPTQINMVGGNNVLLASTSDLRNGADFDVTWKDTGTGA